MGRRGARDLSVVVADEQTAGRGRLGGSGIRRLALPWRSASCCVPRRLKECCLVASGLGALAASVLQ